MEISEEFFDQSALCTSGKSLHTVSEQSATSSEASGSPDGSEFVPGRVARTNSPTGSGASRRPNFIVSSLLEPSQIANLFKLVYFEPYPISLAAKYIGTDNKRLHDFLATKHGKSFFTTSHMEDKESKDQILWVRANTLNLINQKAKFKPIAHERAHTIKRVMNTQGFCEYNPKTKKPHWLNKIYQYNQVDFLNYKNRINNKALLFSKDTGKPDNFFAPLLTLPYSTRFTDKIKQKAIRAKYFEMMELSGIAHTKALMLTVTEDPKAHDNLWDTNKSHSIGMNNLISFLKKRIKAEIRRYPDFRILYEAVKKGVIFNYESLSGLRNRYIKLLHQQYRREYPSVTYQDFKTSLYKGKFSQDQIISIIKNGYTASSHFKDVNEDTFEFQYLNIGEFQLNGRLHSHFLIFGLDYIIDVHELSKILPSYGLGKITHIYALKKNPNNPTAWTWKNPKNTPQDARNKDPIDYLKVYLLKAQYAVAVNYWVFNSRYYTNSRNFEPMDKRIAKALLRKQKRLAPKYWTFIGTIDAHLDQFSNIRYVGTEEYLKVVNSLLQSPDESGG